MPIYSPKDQVVDGEVVGGPARGPTAYVKGGWGAPRVDVSGAIPVDGGLAPGGGPAAGGDGTQNAQLMVPASYEARAKAVALFVRIPFCTYLALSPKLPGFVRIMAGGLAIWDAVQIARNVQEISDLIPLDET